MTRAELENKAFEITKSDMECIYTSDEEILEEIRNTSDSDLEEYISSVMA